VSRSSLLAFAALALTSACAKERQSRASSAVQQGTARTTSALFARGDSLNAVSEYGSARAAYDSAAHLAGTNGDSAAVSRALTALGLIAWHEGRFDESKSIGEQALALKERLGLKRDIPKSLNALGLLAQSRGQLDEALRRFEATRAAAEAVHDSGYLAKARANLGLVYPDFAEFDRARSELLAAADGAKAVGDLLTEANAWNNLGRLEARIGNPDRAIAWLQSAHDRYQKLEYPVGLENSLGQLGYAYAQRGEPSRAIAYLDSAKAIAVKHELREAEADDIELMAEIYELVGDHKRSLELSEQARSLDDSLNMWTKLGEATLEEAFVYAALNNLGLAQRRAREAADEQRGAGARMNELDALSYVAELAQRSGDSAGARAALAAARVVANDIQTGVARIKLALAAAQVSDLAGRSDEVLAALDGNRRDLHLLAAGEQAEVEALRARAYFREKRYPQAVDAGRRAVTSLERIRDHLDIGALRTSFTAQQVETYSDLVITLLALGRVDDAFRIADAARGRGLVERLGAAGNDLRASASAADMAAANALLRRIDTLIARLRDTDARPPNDDRSAGRSSDAITSALHDARNDYEHLIDRITHVDSGATVLGATTLDAATIRRSLGPREALVEFLVADDRILVFVLRQANARWISVPIARTDLAERVRLARELIAARDPGSSAPLRALYTTLIEPIERAGFLGDVTALIIVPHAALTYLPFAALQDADSHYLVERYAVTSLSSASALPTLRRRSTADLAGGAAIFAPLPTELPATAEEARAVARRVQDARLILGDAATEHRFREALATSSIVHIASHGALNRENPMFSSIRLATPAVATPSSDDNARFETYEMLTTPVRSRLVFLSGCETALGGAWSNTFGGGEDYATLAQAFLFAGAHNVVATLWRVNDRAAAAFAQKFYERIDDADLAEALAAAQRAFVTDRRYGAPFYWAAYSLSGNGRLGRLPAVARPVTPR